MANTTNLNLTKLAGTEKLKTFPSPYNDNMDAIDGAFGTGFGVSGKPTVNAEINSLADGLAIISNNNTHAAITAGQFVYVRGHGSLSDGLYVATANIAANGTLSGSNLTADTAGGLNALNSKINLIGTEYVSSGTSGAEAGTREITCPAGTYLLTFGGQTQAKNTACNMNVNGGTAWQRYYVGIVTPDNNSSNMCSAYKTERIVLSGTTTLTLNYTAGWYYTEILAIRIQ